MKDFTVQEEYMVYLNIPTAGIMIMKEKGYECLPDAFSRTNQIVKDEGQDPEEMVIVHTVTTKISYHFLTALEAAYRICHGWYYGEGDFGHDLWLKDLELAQKWELVESWRDEDGTHWAYTEKMSNITATKLYKDFTTESLPF